jgi:KDO2-lipid IV(A) lauroyltransferase
VVYRNLHNSFPEKSDQEIQRIAGKFYHNLADLVLETIKSSKMKREEVEKRVVFKNKELMDQLYHDGKNVFASLGHCGNWEWVGNKIALFLLHEGGAIYKPIHDKFFDEYMVSLRQRYKGTLMIDYKKVFRTLLSLRDKLYTVFVLADQSPARTEINNYEHFLGQSTAFYDGMEKVARALNYAVIYLDVQRVKRGYYEVVVIPIVHDAKLSEEGYVTKEYVKLLEASIRKNPDNWLWSHNRWKKPELKPD